MVGELGVQLDPYAPCMEYVPTFGQFWLVDMGECFTTVYHHGYVEWVDYLAWGALQCRGMEIFGVMEDGGGKEGGCLYIYIYII